MIIEKARPQTVVPNIGLQNNRSFGEGGYFAFIANVIKNTITRIIILTMYFITTTSLSVMSEI